MNRLGVDPGLSGAFALYDSDRRAVIGLFDMPVLQLGGARRHVDHVQAAARIRDWHDVHGIDGAIVEQVSAMPGQGVSSMFKFGASYGIVLGLLAALEIPIQQVPPAVWKRKMNVPAVKDGARARANALIPKACGHWPLKKHDGRAEAALLCLYPDY